jgi:multidrug efflux system membrane fusion protein
VKAKAEFVNDDESLFPNQFVNVRLLLDVMKNAIVIPTSALERGSSGLFVYVVQDDHSVQVRNIKTGPTEGEKVAITDGLKVGETVVTSGADRLRDGSKVELPGEEPPAQKSADGQKRQGNRGDGQQNAQGAQSGQGREHRRGGNGSNAPANDPNAPAQAPGSNPSSSPPPSNPSQGSSNGG